MNVPQTLILFKIASVILAMQKYLEGAVIDDLNDCSIQIQQDLGLVRFD